MIAKTIQNSYEFNRDAQNDDTIINTLTEDDLEIHKSFNLGNIHPEYYKDTKHLICKGMKLVKVSLLNHDDISLLDVNGNVIKTQRARLSGSQEEADQRKLHASVHNNGWLLHTLPIQVYYDSITKKYYVITGMSRLEELNIYNFDKVYVNVWQGNPNSSTKDIDHDKDYLGLLFNPSTIHQAPSSEQDLIAYGVRQVQSEYISNNFDEISDEVSPLISAAGYGDSRKTYILAKILERCCKGVGKVVPMRQSELSEFKERANLIDVTGNVKYVYISHDRVAQGLQNSINQAVKNPGAEIRVIVHPGVLTGDPETDYNNRINKFWDDTYSFLENLSKILFSSSDINPRVLKQHKRTPPNWSLYGAVPSVSSIHNLSKLNLFDQDKADGSFI
jgi:hypothetical protein